MSYDEEQQKRSRVVVETPNTRREEYYTRTARAPERTGHSTGVLAIVALVAIAATALVMFLLMNRGDATNTNVSVATAPTPIPTVPTPLPPPPMQTPIVVPSVQQAPPVIVQPPPATTTQPAPVIVAPPAPATNNAGNPASAAPQLDDATIEANVDKVLTNDADLRDAGITVTVINGRATLIGSVKTPDLKARAERLAHSIKGVRLVDNKIMVANATP
ncbi:MAG TPA: BON domain-containing protein [Pyrinomonadaceae bacterium]|nr:BON domain-containing protein [Pyrinomonadaceae bacterium]